MKTLRITILTIGLAATSCSSSSQASPPALGAVSTITTVDQIKTPLDPYLLTADQVKILVRAKDTVTEKCMQGFGLQSLPSDLAEIDREQVTRLVRSPVYGYFDTRTGAYQGYATLRQQDLSAFFGLTPEQHAALYGHDKQGNSVSTLAGRSIPSGGCDKAGLDVIGGRAPRLDESALPDGGPKVPASDPRLRSVDAQWSSCMRKKGYSYSDPATVVSDTKWRPPPQSDPKTYQPGAIEAATLSADMECKRATNLVGVAVAVESSYDKQYIRSHTDALADYRQKVDREIDNALRIINVGH